MKIEIPMLPPKECSPNARVHWAKRYKAAQQFKEAVGWNAKSVARGMVPLEQAIMTLTFVVAEERIRDEDNWRARFKSGQDGLVAGGVLVHDDINHLTVKRINFVVDPVRAPLTIIEIEEVK